MHFGYSQGYADALRDSYSWFDNHRHIFEEKPYKARIKDIALGILRHFVDSRDRLFYDKECYELDIYIPNDKKKPIKIRPYLSNRQPQHTEERRENLKKSGDKFYGADI